MGAVSQNVCTFASCIDTAERHVLTYYREQRMEERDEKGPRSAAVWRGRQGPERGGRGTESALAPMT